MKKLLFTIGSLVVSAMSFYLYGGSRTMTGIFGFSLKGACYGSILILIFLIPILLIIGMILMKIMRVKQVTIKYEHCLIIALSIIVGAVVSEAQILADEVRFAESMAGTDKVVYGRPRQWPHGICSLVYNKGRGIHATD